MVVIPCYTDSIALLHVRGTHGSFHSSGRTLTSSLSTNAKEIVLTVVIAEAFPYCQLLVKF